MHLHKKRQDWLEPFIAGNVINGKFLTGKTIYLVPAIDGFDRWLKVQQNAFACILERIAFDNKYSIFERCRAIKTITKMPDYPQDKILKLLKDKEVEIVECTLNALSSIEKPEKAVKILLENLDGDRARVSMYSIPRCIRKMNPELLISTLEGILNKDNIKITVRKEAIRLLGQYSSDEGMKILRNEFEKPNQHKDVLIAIGHAARNVLGKEESWKILKSLASSSESDIARSLLYQSINEISLEYRNSYLNLIIKISSHEDSEVSREAFNSMRYWANENEELIASTAAKAIINLEDTIRWKDAMNILVDMCYDGRVNKFIIDIFNNLVNIKIDHRWNASKDRDLPSRQRLMMFVNKLASLPNNIRLKLISLYDSIINCMQSDQRH